MNLNEACEAVADLFEAVPETWSTMTNARNADGEPVSTCDPTAESFCVRGALAAAMNISPVDANFLLRPAADKLFGLSPALVNDTLGRLAAIRLLREAAKCQK